MPFPIVVNGNGHEPAPSQPAPLSASQLASIKLSRSTGENFSAQSQAAIVKALGGASVIVHKRSPERSAQLAAEGAALVDALHAKRAAKAQKPEAKAKAPKRQAKAKSPKAAKTKTESDGVQRFVKARPQSATITVIPHGKPVAKGEKVTFAGYIAKSGHLQKTPIRVQAFTPGQATAAISARLDARGAASGVYEIVSLVAEPRRPRTEAPKLSPKPALRPASPLVLAKCTHGLREFECCICNKKEN
jgi:hypothetical protein